MKKLDLIIYFMTGWITFPALCVWLMLTQPGKCILIWKKELSGTWWNNKKPPCDGELVCAGCGESEYYLIFHHCPSHDLDICDNCDCPLCDEELVNHN